jgi:uncharacterized protein (TIGR00269 family)
VKSFKEELVFTLDEQMSDPEGVHHPCSLCGKNRRRLLNEAAKGFDVLATGHNADDECQAVLMNVVKGNTAVFSRIGPITKSGHGYVKRIKPLYFCTEKEVMAYALLKGFSHGFNECPYSHESYRGLFRDELNKMATQEQRREILRRFLKMKDDLIRRMV